MSLLNPYFASQLSDTISFLRAIEREFRSRSGSEDDSEVAALLMTQADRATAEADYLLDYSAGEVVESTSGDWLLRLPVAVAPAHAIEEQTMNNLMFAFTALSVHRASFAVLLQMADALKIDAESAATAAEHSFHLLSTRSKIAFNILTPNEIDPAVETKSTDDRIA